MIDPKDVTLIIPHLGGSPEAEFALDKCLDALAEDGMDLPMCLVINGDRECKHRNMASIQLKGQGQGLACNAGVSITNTPWVMIYHDDNICFPNWWEEFTKDIKDEKCISPILVEPRPGAPSFITYFCGGAGGDFDKNKWIEFTNNYKGEGIRRGFNTPILIKRELFDLVSGYDIKYDPWGASGDTDLQSKFELSGTETWQNTNCPIYHFSQTSGTFLPEHHDAWSRNYAYFQEKFGYERPGDPDVWFSENIINYEKLRYHPWWEGFYKEKTS